MQFVRSQFHRNSVDDHTMMPLKSHGSRLIVFFCDWSWMIALFSTKYLGCAFSVFWWWLWTNPSTLTFCLWQVKKWHVCLAFDFIAQFFTARSVGVSFSWFGSFYCLFERHLCDMSTGQCVKLVPFILIALKVSYIVMMSDKWCFTMLIAGSIMRWSCSLFIIVSTVTRRREHCSEFCDGVRCFSFCTRCALFQNTVVVTMWWCECALCSAGAWSRMHAVKYMQVLVPQAHTGNKERRDCNVWICVGVCHFCSQEVLVVFNNCFLLVECWDNAGSVDDYGQFAPPETFAV